MVDMKYSKLPPPRTLGKILDFQNPTPVYNETLYVLDIPFF